MPGNMRSLLTPEKALIFRIVHRDNFPWILANGLHCLSSHRSDPNFVSIGNPDLISRRHYRRVPISAGGGLSDYVPFYFTPLSVMLFNIKTGYRGVRQRPNNEIIILFSSLHKLQADGAIYLFTDRHAYLASARFFSSVTELSEINWPILQNRDFTRDNENPEKMEQYQARVQPIGVVLLMITFTQGNLLEADVEALVNTVNTVGVMGKGIALMFKEAFPENFKLYQDACKAHKVEIGRVFPTERRDVIGGPKWIINFPTKQHWRGPSKIEWIERGLADLRHFIEEHSIRSVALPPLGSGNGRLDWQQVRPLILRALGSMPDVTIVVYEPTPEYQNVAKREGVEKLTPARALMMEIIRRYWVLGFECTLLEIHKLAYFLEIEIVSRTLPNPLNLECHRLRRQENGSSGALSFL